MAEDPERVARRLAVLAQLRGGKQKGNKFGARGTYYEGVRYASKAEAERAEVLDLLMASGEIIWWIRQPTLYLGCAENVYRPDFLVIPAKGLPWLEDWKGAETQKFKRDKRLWRRYGRLELRVLKAGAVESIGPADSLSR